MSKMDSRDVGASEDLESEEDSDISDENSWIEWFCSLRYMMVLDGVLLQLPREV